jgi:hypothetical protein
MLGDRDPVGVRLLRGRLDVGEEADVMVVCDGDGVEALLAARGDEAPRVLLPAFLGLGAVALPVAVAGAVDLEVTAVKTRAFVHVYVRPLVGSHPPVGPTPARDRTAWRGRPR